MLTLKQKVKCHVMKCDDYDLEGGKELECLCIFVFCKQITIIFCF
jgi:hypothetical protein